MRKSMDARRQTTHIGLMVIEVGSEKEVRRLEGVVDQKKVGN